MDAGIVIAIISSVEGIGVAFIGYMISRSNKKANDYRVMREKLDAERDEREKDARKIREASYGLLFALADGLDVLLHKAHGDKLNGEVEKAIDAIDGAKDKLDHMANKTMSKL